MPRLFQKQGPGRTGDQRKEEGGAAMEIKLPVPNSLQTHGKRMLMSSTLKLFPAVLRTWPEIKTAVRAHKCPKGYVQ